MKNATVLEMINDGKIEELKALLQDEIYTESMKGNTDGKKRYSAMKKYFTYVTHMQEALNKPCTVEVEGKEYNFFTNGWSFVLTTENTGEIEHFADKEKYFKLDKMISYDGEEKTVDFQKILAEAKSKGYKLKKSEVNGDFSFLMKYNGAYYKIGLLDATYGIINDGKPATVYHNGNRNSPILIKNEIGIALVLPVSVSAE